MTLQFTETAPGVHTTTLVNPKSDVRHNIAVIESCGAYQVFVDGELAVRDLASFQAAVDAATAHMSAPKTSYMVRAASVLVVLSIVGATAVAVSKFIPAADTANASAIEAASPIVTTFKRVRPSNDEADLAAKAVEKATASPDFPRQKAAVQPVAKPAKVKLIETPASAIAAKPTASGVAPSRRFSSTNHLLSLKPVVEISQAPGPVAPEAEAPSAGDTVAAADERHEAAKADLPPVTIIKRRSSARDVAKAPHTSADIETPPVPEPVSFFAETEAAAPTTVSALSPAVPPVPTPNVQRRDVPVIRSETAPIEPAKLSKILGGLEEEEETEAASPPARQLVKRTTRRRPAAEKSKAHRKSRSKVSKRTSTKRSQRRRVTKRRSAPSRRRSARRLSRRRSVSRAPRVVCFAHTCRLR